MSSKTQQLEVAKSALERIFANSTCPDPAEGGCIPSAGCAFETARNALREIQELENAERAEEARATASEADGLDVQEEMANALVSMRAASNTFYRMAQRTRIHTFLEVNGFLVELIQMYEQHMTAGGNFITDHPRPKPHQMSYIAEKIDCIFGEILAEDPASREAFLRTLEEKGGWRWRRGDQPVSPPLGSSPTPNASIRTR